MNTLNKTREQTVMEMLRTKPVKSDSKIMRDISDKEVIEFIKKEDNDKRRKVVNKIKGALVVQFQREVAILHHKNSFDNEYDDKMFCKEMTSLIEMFQGKLDKLKINGKFYDDKNLPPIKEESKYDN